MKAIKHMNDFVLGILTTIVALFLLFGKITQQEVTTGQGGYLARSDIWLRMIAVFLLVVSVALIVRAINFKKDENVDGFKFYLDSTVVATVASLIAYALALPRLGFFISTFLIIFFLVVLYSVKEQGLKFTTVPKNQWGKIFLKATIVSIVLLIVFWIIFGKLLAIQLPEFSLMG